MNPLTTRCMMARHPVVPYRATSYSPWGAGQQKAKDTYA